MMTADEKINIQLERAEKRRLAEDDRALARMERRWQIAERLIGELCREGKKVYYINLKDRNGRPTGKIKEGCRYELIRYLLRNGYVW